MKRLVFGWLFCVYAAAASLAGGTEIIAHRGASFDAPENTVAAIRLAWDQGADAVEFDIHLSKDGRIVLMHDKDTKRTGGRARLVAEQTLAELRELDVGGWGKWKGSKYKGERVATLGEVLPLIPKGKRAFIEVKCGVEIVPELKRVIEAAALAPEQTAVISFSADVVAETKKVLPKLAVYWLVDPKPANDPKTGKPNKPPIWTEATLLTEAKRIGADGLDLSVQPLVSADFIRRARSAGLPVYVWTINDLDVARRMIEAGAIGITTDRPGWVREELKMGVRKAG